MTPADQTPTIAAQIEALEPSTEYINRSNAHRRHGHTMGGAYSDTYSSWQCMLARCRYQDRDQYNKHIGRGISVCSRWLTFENFLEDLGERPAGTTLDRFPNNDGNYEPGNCRWATPIEQSRNRRNAKLNLDTATQVAVARLSGETCASIASRFHCSESLPREIAKGRTWPDALDKAKAILGMRND
jgi:hypothetical protein